MNCTTAENPAKESLPLRELRRCQLKYLNTTMKHVMVHIVKNNAVAVDQNPAVLAVYSALKLRVTGVGVCGMISFVSLNTRDIPTYDFVRIGNDQQWWIDHIWF